MQHSRFTEKYQYKKLLELAATLQHSAQHSTVSPKGSTKWYQNSTLLQTHHYPCSLAQTTAMHILAFLENTTRMLLRRFPILHTITTTLFPHLQNQTFKQNPRLPLLPLLCFFFLFSVNHFSLCQSMVVK